MRERGTVFGEVADEYDRIRPGYPAALAEHLLAAAGPGPVLDPVAAEAALDDTLAVVDSHGGTIDFVIHTDVALVRRPAQ
ncbi:hypothetical protein M1L60_05680 [Actinoplanes sp. TRM 88003]|uniref:Methyltransferase n=1 Tax=Paractinoplanes aksuensis TaxID=2939490 RepID=A0ABT1DJ10_9ACTN|nr:hypothetical protein [Actinoplanes aksuensis]MCO8270081.1 hypothetical protein [Actinoplanes aksuensis]